MKYTVILILSILLINGCSNGTGAAITDPFMGNDNAEVTITAYMDYDCYPCYLFMNGTFPYIDEDYIDTGDVKYVFKSFPGSGDNALEAAEAGNCAQEQGEFWQMHNMLFDKQPEWENETSEIFEEYAHELKLDEEKFKECMESHKYRDEIQDDREEAKELGGRAPLFTVNRGVVELPIFSIFKERIDEELE